MRLAGDHPGHLWIIKGNVAICTRCDRALAIRCLVPGCVRVRGNRKGHPTLEPTSEWICEDHWRLVPRWMKAILTRSRKRRAAFPSERSGPAADRIWARCKRAAIERAMGI